MNVKNIFTKNKLSKSLSFSQQGNIWRMFFSPGTLIGGETRDPETKQVYFFTLNYKTGEVILRNFQLFEKWWISICEVSDRFIFLSSFRKPDLPEYLGIITIDVLTGDTQWENDELVFLFGTDEVVYGYKQLFENKKYYELNATSGEVIHEITGDNIGSLLLTKQEHDTNQYKDFVYPQVYNLELNNPNNGTADYILSRFDGIEISGPIEYINFGRYLIYNFHERMGIDRKNITKQVLTNKLEVYDLTTSDIVYEEVLNRNVSNYVPDSFFIKDSFLFYVKEKRALTSIKL